ncbi:MAG: S8 family serine peptidase [Anaerotruncus sp.]|nr:S8 family serine peptidase [Anaerotruncus sp.]
MTNESNCIGFFAEVGTEVDVFVAWDGWPVTDQDYDLYLLDSSGNAVDASLGIQTGIQPPTEELFSIVPRTGFYCIAIDKYSANRNHSFMVVTPGIDLSPNVPQTSLGSPADARGPSPSAPLDVGIWTTGPVAGYSSQGPTRDGRLKPEIVAPTSVSTFSFGFEPFAGTSSSAPHVAGAAALILSGNPGYTAAQLREALLASALDMDLPGQDNISGYGRLNLQPVLPVPLGQKRLPYAPAVQPVNNTVPEQAKPLSVGAVAQAGATLSLRISFLPFTGAVDIYVALFAPAVSPDLFLIHPDLLPRPASQGVVPWRAGTRGPVNESLYGDIAVRSLPPGRYEVLVAVTPAGKTDSYVLWDTFFDVP